MKGRFALWVGKKITKTANIKSCHKFFSRLYVILSASFTNIICNAPIWGNKAYMIFFESI